MAVNSLSAAKRICQCSGWTLSNLELQKILYLAHMFHMGRTSGSRLLDGQFEAWDYGPVEPRVYSKVRMFGSAPISDVFYGAGEIPEGTQEAESIAQACSDLIGMSAGQLVAITHWEGGAWAKVYQPGVRHVPIPDELIINEFRSRAARSEGRSGAAA